MDDQSHHHTTVKVSELEGRVYHIDGQVQGLKEQLTTQGATLTRIEAHIMNKPAPNYIGILSLGVTILIGALGLTGGMAAFMNTQIGHVRDDVQALWENNKTQEEFRHQMHYEIGGLTHADKQHDSEITKLWNHIHKLEEEDKKHINLIKENQMRSRAIGDYVEKMDEVGTHWGNTISKDAAQAIGRIQGSKE